MDRRKRSKVFCDTAKINETLRIFTTLLRIHDSKTILSQLELLTIFSSVEEFLDSSELLISACPLKKSLEIFSRTKYRKLKCRTVSGSPRRLVTREFTSRSS
jgi:hypothetical protein